MDDFDNHLGAQLETEEGLRYRIYDDATGQPFTKGMTLAGNLSAGTGINLMIPFDATELAFLEGNRIDRARKQLSGFAWYADQDEVRQVALADLAFNLGIGGLLNWPHFLGYMASRDYPSAMQEIRNNRVWINEVHPVRANRIEAMILTGLWPADLHPWVVVASGTQSARPSPSANRTGAPSG